MSFLDKTGLQTLTNKLVQGDAIKVASHRGHTVKNVIDNIQRECDNVANPLEYKIENRVTDFKIGKGRDVDVSGDVENGCTEVELKGKTYQNLYIKDIFNGDISNWSALTSGQYSFSDGYLTLTANGGYVNAFEKISTLMVKPNTKYTAIFDIKENTLSTERKNNFTLVSGTTSAISDTSMFLPPKKTGLYPVSFTTKSDLSACNVGLRSFIYTGTMSGKITFNYILLEGDHTQTLTEELPKYFIGIKSSFEDGIVDVEVQGKNLFDISQRYKISGGTLNDITNTTINFTTSERNGSIVWKIPKPNTNKVTLSANILSFEHEERFGVYLRNVDKETGDWGRIMRGFKVVKKGISSEVIDISNWDCDEIMIMVYAPVANSISSNIVLKDIQLEETDVLTEYEPYYKKKISFNIDEPLRSLPNGVCDEIRNNNGQWELVRRVNKVVLDGSENWNNNTGWETDNTMALWTILHSITNLNSSPWVECISNNFVNYGEKINTVDCNGIRVNQRDTTMDYILYIRIEKSRLSTHDVAGLKQWLAKNPTTVYYKLDTPIITPIEPIEFEIKPLGSININSDISPVSYHTVQLNRAGQIERAICNIAELKNRVEALETIYDSHFLETQHKLSLLEMDYELEGGSV